MLHLRYIPARDYVQVRVLNDEGGFLVDPASVEVIQRAVVTVGELEDSDPVRGEPGWRRVTDLDQACRDGLVHDVVRQGGSWTDMFERLRHMIGPLLEAGWAIIDEDRETSANYGDSVSYVLERSDDVMQLELYEDDAIMLWPFDENEYPPAFARADGARASVRYIDPALNRGLGASAMSRTSPSA